MLNCSDQEYSKFINFYIDPKCYYGREYDENHLSDVIENLIKIKLHYRDEFGAKYIIPDEQNAESLIKYIESKLSRYKRIEMLIKKLAHQVLIENRFRSGGFTEINLALENHHKKVTIAKEIMKNSMNILKPKSKITFALLFLDDIRKIINKYYNRIIDKETYRIITVNKKFPYMDTEMLLYITEYSFEDQEKIRTNKIENLFLIEHYDCLYNIDIKEYLHKIIELLKSEERTDVKWKYILNDIASDIVTDFSIIIDFIYEIFLKPMEKYLD